MCRCGGLVGRDGDVESGLDTFDALQQCGLGVTRRRQQQSGADNLEQQSGRGGPAHLAQPGMHHLGIAGQCRRSDTRRLITHPFQNVDRRVNDTAARRVRNRLQHNEIPETLQ